LAASVKKSYLSKYREQLQTWGIDPQVMEIRCVPTVTALLKGDEVPDNGLFLEIGEKRHTMILFLKRHVVLVRTFASGGEVYRQSVNSEGNGDSASDMAKRIESEVEIFCTSVQNTIHAYKWQNNQNIQLEKIYFTGPGAIYQETGNLISRYLDLPVEQINLRGNQRIGMENEITPVWNAALMDNALALALRDEGRAQGFNFRKGEFEIKKQYTGLKRELRTWAVFLIIILAFLSADLGAEYYFVKKRNRILDHEIMEVFKQTFPKIQRVVDPVQQMRVEINEIKTSAVSVPGMGGDQKVLDLLKDVSERIPSSLDVQLTSMVVDPDAVRISGETDTFNTVDSIKNDLEPSAYFSQVTISSANLDRSGKRVQFELKLQRTR
jgi:general secretion pathway protein L